MLRHGFLDVWRGGGSLQMFITWGNVTVVAKGSVFSPAACPGSLEEQPQV